MGSMEHGFNGACSVSKEECQTSIAESNKPSFKLDEPVTTVLNINSMKLSMTPNNFSVNDENSLSFVVLGKDSVDAQASALASYVDIQQKCMSVDYKSMVLSLNADEMQKKLSDMLQENVKLKETLRLNTLSMKEQFNTLAMWQEKVMKVHETHKKKFAETRELVNHLKKENVELKTKLSHLQHTESIGFETIGTIPQSDTTAQTELQQITPKLKIAISKMDLEECKQYITCVISEKFAEKALQDKLEELKLEKELESAMKSLNCIDSETSAKIVENQKRLKAKDEEINYLKESIALLKEKLQCALTPIQLQDLSESSSTLSRQKFVQNIKQYNNILQELTECYVKQIERFATIEKSLKEITDIFMILDDDDNSKMQFYQCREKLCHCCKQLADEQVKIISDRQTLIKSQNQFQKIFSDYNSILYELEITIDENAKLNVLKDNSAREKLQKLEESEQIQFDKQLLEEESKIFNQQKLNLEEEKNLLESQKKSLDMERITLHEDMKRVMQEKISLNEEKMSLDHQSQLYENCEKALKDEKELLRVRCEELLDKIKSLRQENQKKDIELKEVIGQYAQSVEEISLLRSQLTMYEEDFVLEKRLKESLLDEKNKLDMELLKQIEFNQQLQSGVKQITSSVTHSPEHLNGATATCPKCAKAYQGLGALMEHIENCLD
ncbi:unnamed protein product [Lasius platythorax]|uniref:NF-kappa-B essential modulator NEMO N-terminal domain-containing protein n=1 Tax=Lasius platythorax TaxID=488582 RepID=A0AAV2NPN1_9HYME